MPTHRQSADHSTRPLALLVAAHPIWNVPPFVNAARELARHGYRVIVIGYQTSGLPNAERLGERARILRVPVTSRRIRWAGLRRFFAVIEFLTRSRRVIRRLRPDVLITFNDPASVLQRLTPAREGMSRVSWLLEYPELERMNFIERTLIAISASCWKKAELIVVPTRERLALHLALRPQCAERTTLIVQNAPLSQPPARIAPSPRTQAALRYLKQCPAGTIRIVYSGAIGNRYGADSLIRAAGSFRTGIQLLLLGKKHPLAEEEVNEAVKATAFPDNIEWIDEVPYRELSQILSSCDVGFATYRGDTLNTRFSAPGKLYEYLKSGLVILSDDHCCIYSDAVAAGCGVFFGKPVTDDGIRLALDELLSRQRELTSMKDSARRLFERRLCMEEQMKPLLERLPPFPQPSGRLSPIRDREPVRV